MSFRKEKKFRLTHSDQNSLVDTLINAGMKPLFPAREVISCYFDNSSLEMYLHSDEGVLPRKKIRIRRYGTESSCKKETKISSIEGRFKISEVLSNEGTENFFNINLHDSLYGTISPVLVVKYYRQYFQLDQMRITVDKNITYQHPRSSSQLHYTDSEGVVEIKVGKDISDDYIEKWIPYPTSRFSKYSRGMFSLGYLV